MTITATMPAEVVCKDCSVVVKPGSRPSCFRCHTTAIRATEAEHRAAAGRRMDSSALRKWATRRFLMGQISREVRAELELAADDIECGHG